MAAPTDLRHSVRPAHPVGPAYSVGPGRPAGVARGPRTFSDGFALLAECLLVGVYVLIASLPVITVPAALAAGTAHLRRHLAGQGTGIGWFARDWWAAVRDLWVLGVAGPALAGILALNAEVVASGLLPGGQAVRWGGLAVAVVSAVVILRVAGVWSVSDDGGRAHPGRSLVERSARSLGGLVSFGTRQAREDLVGTLLLVVAIGLCGVLVWMLTPLIAVVGGLLCLAVVAVGSRHDSKLRQERAPSTSGQ
ncbi:hypothetical protein [Myceligenerans xiligouense]|uniref:Uncharacterized protein n=1 Tax=Myceligenerans xiligouense TaxID=253184 RepID=A0A3N4YPV8_9MICO|nr:hypothetical protein [Myceligenerans xiligouense]RPF23089.1 hypothetical protein EDD34_3769 [Myceligenerans xiligouense]